jgi:hypothetical protein
MGRKALASTAANAISQRDATFALFVSRTPAGLAAEIGEWAEGSCDGGRWIAVDDAHLETVRSIDVPAEGTAPGNSVVAPSVDHRPKSVSWRAATRHGSLTGG